MANLKKDIEKYALANAFLHNGKANSGAVLGKLISKDSSIKSKIKNIMPDINKITSKVNKLSIKEQESKLKKIYPDFFKPKEVEEKVLPELPNVSGRVIMRFEPSPSGPLHIGHAYTLNLNSEFCKNYKGKLIIRISDTNPDNIYPKAYKMIPEDANWVTKGNVQEVAIQSDNLKNYYKVAEKLLKIEKAYVCDCDPEKWRKLMLDKKSCDCRNLKAKSQLTRWRKMLSKQGYKQGEAVLRIKTNLKHKNPAIRDWPALRINETKHPRQGKKYRVWPLMNFAVAVDDHFMNITHAVRMKEHRDNELKQKYMYNYLKWKMPTHLYVGAINFIGIPCSCSKVRPLIEDKVYSGWDDPRIPFLRALKRRGYQPEALIKYAIQVGPTENDKTVNGEEFYKQLDSLNRDIIDLLADRYFFVPNPVKIEVKDLPKIKEITLKVHPEKAETRKVKLSGNTFYITKQDFKKFKGKEIRLKDLVNIKLNKKSKFTSKKNKEIPKIQWVSKDNISAEILMPSGETISGLAEIAASKLKPGSIIQFERVGFARLDRKKQGKIIFYYLHK